MPVVQAKKKVNQKTGIGKRVDESLMGPGQYEISADVKFEIKLHLKDEKGRWVLMAGPGKDIFTNVVIFRMWTFDEMIAMRKMATSYDTTKRVHMIDNDALNRLKIQKMMLSWTFDKNNPRLKLLHVNQVLSDESWIAFTSLQPNISSHIIEEMNKVYEFNG